MRWGGSDWFLDSLTEAGPLVKLINVAATGHPSRHTFAKKTLKWTRMHAQMHTKHAQADLNLRPSPHTLCILRAKWSWKQISAQLPQFHTSRSEVNCSCKYTVCPLTHSHTQSRHCVGVFMSRWDDRTTQIKLHPCFLLLLMHNLHYYDYDG